MVRSGFCGKGYMKLTGIRRALVIVLVRDGFRLLNKPLAAIAALNGGDLNSLITERADL